MTFDRPGAIRPLTPDDLPVVIALLERQRIVQEREQPIFWRKADDSAARSAQHLPNVLRREGTLALVHETDGTLDGFLVGMALDAPPVYDPGGTTCLIDDFIVADPVLWPTVGSALLDAAQEEARARGLVCMQVICGHYDAPKRAMLAAAGFPVVSEWWVRPL